MAAGNTIAALEAGARCASVTVNGLGERAGNAALEEVVMALKVACRLDCGVRTSGFYELSRLVAAASGAQCAGVEARHWRRGVPARIGHSLCRSAAESRNLRAVSEQ